MGYEFVHDVWCMVYGVFKEFQLEERDLVLGSVERKSKL